MRKKDMQPCPWCGKTDNLMIITFSERRWHGNETLHKVQCVDIGNGPFGKGHRVKGPEKFTEEAAILVWNNRS